jgi:hypothetical protein
VSRMIPISTAIDELEIAVMCSEQDEWKNLVAIFRCNLPVSLHNLVLRVPGPLSSLHSRGKLEGRLVD